MQVSTLPNSKFAPSSVAHIGAPIRLQTGREVHLIKPLVRWTFYAFVFSMLFEAAPIGIPVEMTQITGGLLVAAAVLIQPRLSFRRPPAAFWCFVLYFCVGILTLLFYQVSFDRLVILREFTLLQLIFLFWIAYNVMRDERAARGTLLSLGAACAALSLLKAFGLTTTTEADMSRLVRFSAYGLDSVQLAGALSLGVLALVGLVYGLKRNIVRPRYLILPVIALIGMTIVQTGSRGGLLALASGLLVLTFRKATVFTKLRNAFIVLLGLGLLIWLVFHSAMLSHRFQLTLEDGDMSGREEIYPRALQMFLERPVTGWGPVVNTIELGNRLQLPARHERKDTHNSLLYVLTATGIIGAIPFCAGVWMCVRAAWKARGGTHGILPLAMTVSLLTADMSVSGLHWKQYWLILAYALASGCQFVTKPERTRLKPNLLSLRSNLALRSDKAVTL